MKRFEKPRSHPIPDVARPQGCLCRTLRKWNEQCDCKCDSMAGTGSVTSAEEVIANISVFHAIFQQMQDAKIERQVGAITTKGRDTRIRIAWRCKCASARFRAHTRPPKSSSKIRNRHLTRLTYYHHLRQHQPTATMPGVSVRDVPADKFIDAYSAFLKRQGKLPIPGP